MRFDRSCSKNSFRSGRLDEIRLTFAIRKIDYKVNMKEKLLCLTGRTSDERVGSSFGLSGFAFPPTKCTINRTQFDEFDEFSAGSSIPNAKPSIVDQVSCGFFVACVNGYTIFYDFISYREDKMKEGKWFRLYFEQFIFIQLRFALRMLFG